MARWVRGVAALALAAGFTAVGAPDAGAGDTFPTNIVVGIEIVGTPPQGATWVVETNNAQSEQMTFTVASPGPTLNPATVGSGNPVFESDTQGASAVTYDCTTTNIADCDVFPDRVEYDFPGGPPGGQVNITIT